jgi:hypothetical protein
VLCCAVPAAAAGNVWGRSLPKTSGPDILSSAEGAVALEGLLPPAHAGAISLCWGTPPAPAVVAAAAAAHCCQG